MGGQCACKEKHGIISGKHTVRRAAYPNKAQNILIMNVCAGQEKWMDICG
jgi:hypothetical protein